MNDPLVSVLIPCYNAGAFLRPSVESILRQGYTNLEIIIVDDGSTDDCLDTINDLKDARLRTIRQENGGRASAMNRALEAAQGDFYIAHDADDLSHPERVERQLDVMRQRPEIAAVFTGHDLLIKGKLLGPRLCWKDVQECRRDIDRFRMPGIGATPMYRLSIVGDIRFETSLCVGEDLDYVLRVGERYPMIRLGLCLYTYRIHSDSSTRMDPLRNYRMEREVFRRACERRGWDPARNLPSPPGRWARMPHRQRERGVVPHLIESVLDLRRERRFGHAVRTACASVAMHPFDPYYYRPLIYCGLPFRLLAWYRAAKERLR